MDKRATSATTLTRAELLEVLAHADPVGPIDIADRLEVQRQTITVWKRRHANFPKARWTVSGHPTWDWNADIVPWLKATRRYDWPEEETGG